MCLVGLALNHFPDFPLVLVANRDEFHDRPTAPLHRWQDIPTVIAGRDLEAGGTWLGATEQGRFAVLTNLRNRLPIPPDAPSRGQLVTRFLTSDRSPAQWVVEQRAVADGYAGFNLIVGELGGALYSLSNLPGTSGASRVVDDGIHAISNGPIDEPWPKTQALMAALRAVEDPADTAALCQLLEDTRCPGDDQLPNTGVGLELERRLAPRLIVGEQYGTRSTTVLQLHVSGTLCITEYTRATSGRVASQTDIEHQLTPPSP